MFNSGSVPRLGKDSFTHDPERGLVASVPEKYVAFMGHPLSIVIERGGFLAGGVAATEIDQANQIVRLLPGCIHEAEQQLRE